jgi:GNAT superfamily N-acetyltransferase
VSAIVIREAGRADAALLVALIRDAFAEYLGRLDPPSSAHGKTAAVVQAELADGGALLAELDGVAVGCVFFHPRADHVYLDRLAVLPPYRRRGIARLLIAGVEERARALGYSRVRLSVRLALSANRASYERLGYHFHSYGTHVGYSAPTSVTLEKRLDVPDGAEAS